eukprot:scaffold4093_cov166-Amphora_coffeaeformis.AAC.2
MAEYTAKVQAREEQRLVQQQQQVLHQQVAVSDADFTDETMFTSSSTAVISAEPIGRFHALPVPGTDHSYPYNLSPDALEPLRIFPENAESSQFQDDLASVESFDWPF